METDGALRTSFKLSGQTVPEAHACTFQLQESFLLQPVGVGFLFS